MRTREDDGNEETMEDCNAMACAGDLEDVEEGGDDGKSR